MWGVVLGVALFASGLAHAGCPEFLAEIKPYQLAYSRAETIFQQQVALTAIQIIQKQYTGEACKFRLDAYDEQVLQERAVAAKLEEAANAEREERKRKDAERAETEEMKRQAPELRSEISEQERTQYINGIQNKVVRNWIKPPSAKPGLSCKVAVTQIPGGEVTNVRVTQCTGDEVFQRSVEAAVYKASPLPTPTDPALFDRDIEFTFKVDSGLSKTSRSFEEVSMVFDKNKGAIYSLYSRALRQNPTLRGKVVLEITIDPTGRVTECQIFSSELNSPELESKLIERVKLLNFGVRNAEIIVVRYPIDFLPS